MPHEEFREWLKENRITLKDLCRDVGVSNLSYYTTDGHLFPPEYIQKWQETYGWTDEQAFCFQYDRHFKKSGEMFKTQAEEEALNWLRGLKGVLRGI